MIGLITRAKKTPRKEMFCRLVSSDSNANYYVCIVDYDVVGEQTWL